MAWPDPSLHQHETRVSWPFHPGRSLNSFSLTFTLVQSRLRERERETQFSFPPILIPSLSFFLKIFPLPFITDYPSLELSSPNFTINRHSVPPSHFGCPLSIPLPWVLPSDSKSCWQRLKCLRVQTRFRLSK